jgi:hypothetical protein
MQKIVNWLIPLFLVGLTFFVRLYRIDNPVADWHSWRQADTAAVARNFIKDDFNFLFPQSDSFLALNEHGLANPHRWFINEFPFYNGIVALIYGRWGINPVFARLVSVGFASLGGLFLFLFTKKLFNQKIAVLTSLFYALNPYNIYYGRVIMPDPAFVSLSIISLYLTLTWVESKRLLSAIFLGLVFGLSLLVKPYALMMGIPMGYWALLNRGKEIVKDKQAYLIAFLSLTPLLLWRWHYANHPEGTFASTWLLNGDNIRFSGAFFRWLIFDRFNRLIFATGGFVLFILGISETIKSKKTGLILTWLLAVLIYMTIFAKGNVTHDYYQLPIMPVGAILVSLGFWKLVNFSHKLPEKLFNWGLGLSLLAISLAFGWYEVRGFFNINHPEIVLAGNAVDQLLPREALVIAPYNGDPAFLYQTNRHGWPEGTQIEEKVKAGATHYVSVNYDDVARYLEERCQTVLKTDQYLILNISACL